MPLTDEEAAALTAENARLKAELDASAGGAKTRIDALGKRAAEAEAQVATLTVNLTAAEQKHAAALAAAREDLDLVRLGFDDDDGLVVVRSHYDRLPAEGRPASRVELAKAWKAAPDTAPRAAQPYVRSAATGAATTTTTTPVKPAVNGGTGGAGGDGGPRKAWTREELAAMPLDEYARRRKEDPRFWEKDH